MQGSRVRGSSDSRTEVERMLKPLLPPIGRPPNQLPPITILVPSEDSKLQQQPRQVLSSRTSRSEDSSSNGTIDSNEAKFDKSGGSSGKSSRSASFTRPVLDPIPIQKKSSENKEGEESTASVSNATPTGASTQSSVTEVETEQRSKGAARTLSVSDAGPIVIPSPSRRAWLLEKMRLKVIGGTAPTTPTNTTELVSPAASDSGWSNQRRKRRRKPRAKGRTYSSSPTGKEITAADSDDGSGASEYDVSDASPSPVNRDGDGSETPTGGAFNESFKRRLSSQKRQEWPTPFQQEFDPQDWGLTQPQQINTICTTQDTHSANTTTESSGASTSSAAPARVPSKLTQSEEKTGDRCEVCEEKEGESTAQENRTQDMKNKIETPGDSLNLTSSTALTEDEIFGGVDTSSGLGFTAAIGDEKVVGASQVEKVEESARLALVLEKVKQKGSLLVRVVTWNLQAKPTVGAAELRKQLLPPHKYHLYMIGSEECENSIAKSVIIQSKKNWEVLLKTTLGPSYTMLCGHSLQATHSIVFAHKGVMPLLHGVRSSAVATGLGLGTKNTTLGNKGGIGICVNIEDTRCVFINAHFAAHQKNVKERVENFQVIQAALANMLTSSAETQLQVPEATSPTRQKEQKDLCDVFDRVVWAGDLNFRIDVNRDIANILLQRNMHEVLLEKDQLTLAKRSGLLFNGYEEGPLNFRPTYKFDKQCDTYDSSPKQRVPAWTDRILFRSKDPEGLELLAYNSIPSLRSSDHRPVIADFKLKFKCSSEETLHEQPATNQTTSELCCIQ